MASNSSKISTTLSYKVQLDTSEIMSKVKALENEMKAKNVDLLPIDETLKKLDSLGAKIQQQLSKGFSSSDDIKNLEKDYTSFLKTGQKLQKSFKDLNTDADQLSLDKLKSSLVSSEKNLDKMIKSAKLLFKTQLDGVKNGQNFSNQYLDAAKNGEDLVATQKKISAELERQVAAQKELSISKQQGFAAAQSDFNNVTSLTKTGVKSTSFKTAKGNKISQDQFGKVTSIYSQIAQNTALKEGTGQDALKAFKKELSSLGIEIKNDQTLLNSFVTTLAASENQATVFKEAQKEANQTSAQLEKLQQNAQKTNAAFASKEATNTFKEVAAAAGEVAEKEKLIGEQSTKIGNETPAMQSLSQSLQNGATSMGAWSESAHDLYDNQKKIDEGFNSLTSTVGTFFSAFTALNQVQNVLRSTFEDVKKIDKAFAEIAMVTDYSVNDMWNSYSQYSKMANELGQSTVDVVKASGLFYQQGLETNEALDLTRSTMKLATLAGQDFKEATSEMTAALRGFHMEMNQGEHIADVYSELAAKAAADVEGIAYAMSKTASIANSAGMSFETTSAFLTQMIETTQEAPENIGTAMKTIIARFTELKENVAGTADSEFSDLNYNDVDEALKSVGVSLKDTSGQFRDLDDVFLELSKKWNTLDRNTQRYIATTAAGSRQQSRFLALMEDYERTMDLVTVAQESEGKASEQFGKYQDTLENKINKLKNSWEQLRLSFANSDIFKNAVESLTAIVNKIESLDAKRLLALTPVIILVAKSFITTFIKTIQTSSNALKPVIEKKIEDLSKVARNKIGKTKIGEKLKINVDTKAFEQEIKGLQAKLDAFEARNKDGQLDLGIDLAKKTGLSGKELTEKVNSAIGGNKEDSAYLEQYGIIPARYLEAGIAAEKLAKAEDEVGVSYAKTSKLIQEQNQKLEQSQQVSQNTIQVLEGVGQALTMMVSTLIAGGDFDDAITSFMIMVGVAFAQIVVQSVATGIAAGKGFGEGIKTGLASTGVGFVIAIIAEAIAALALGIDAIWKRYKKNHKSLSEQLDDAKKRLDELQKTEASAKDEAKTAKDSADSIKELKEEFIQLNNIQVKTTDEQERYAELVSQIREDYPELVKSYDEQTGTLQVQNDLFDSLIEKQQKLAEEAAKKSLFTTYASLGGQELVSERESELNIDKYNKQSDILSKGYFGSEGDKSDYDSDNKWKDKLDNLEEEEKAVVQDLADSLHIDISSDSGVKELANVLAASNEQTARNASLSEDQIKEYQKLLNDYQKTVEDNKKAEEENLKKQKELYDQQREAALSIYAQNALGEDVGVSNILAKSARKAAENENYSVDLKENQLQAGQVTSVGANTGAAIGATIGSVFAPVVGTLIGTALGGTIGGIASNQVVSNINDNLKAYTDLDEETKGILKNLDYTAEKWDEIRKDEDKYADVLKEIEDARPAYREEQLLKQFDENLTQDQKDAISKWSTEASSYTKEQLEEKKVSLTESILGERDEETNGQVYDALQENIDKALSAYNQSLTELKSKTGLIFSDSFSKDQLDSFLQLFQTYVDEAGSDGAKEYFQSVSESLKKYNLSNEDFQSLLGNIDFTKATAATWADFKKSGIETVQKLLGVSKDEAEQVFNDLAKETEDSRILDLTVNTTGEVEELVKTLKEFQKTVYSQKDTILSALNTQAKDGQLALKDYLDLEEAVTELGGDIGDYTTIKNDGTIILDNAEALNQLYISQANSVTTQLKQQKEKLSAELAEHKAQRTSLDIQDKSLKSVYEQVESTLTLEEATEELCKAQQKYLKLLVAAGQLKESDIPVLSFGDNDTITDIKNKVKISLDNLGKEAKDNLDETIKAEEEALAKLEQEIANSTNLDAAYVKDLVQSLKDQVDNLSEEDKKAKEEQQKAAEDLLDAWDDLKEKQKELNDAVNGSKFWENNADALYNYTTNLERVTKAADDAKSALDDLGSGVNVQDEMSKYLASVQQETAIGVAKTQVYENAIANGQKSLNQELLKSIDNINKQLGVSISTDISNLYTKVGDRYNINYDKLAKLSIPDDFKDRIVEEVQSWNDNLDEIESIQEKKLARQKEFNEVYKKSLQGMVDLEEEMKNTLKEKYDDEISNIENKYSAMEEADNEYVDELEKAIEKQRKLRDQENSWNELADKERKLSLMQRDTSGGNLAETRSLQKEVQDDRQDLLDNAIDNMIDGLKEMYELQKESRDAEIEYRKTLIDEGVLMQEVTAALSNINSADDLVNWFYENTANLSEMSTEQIQLEEMQWRELYDSKMSWLVTSQTDFNSALEVSSNEVQAIVKNISELLSSQATTKLDEVTENVTDNIKNIQDSVADAWDTIKERQEALAEAETAAAKVANQYTNALTNLRNAQLASIGSSISSGASTVASTATTAIGKVTSQSKYDTQPQIDLSTYNATEKEKAENTVANAKKKQIQDEKKAKDRFSEAYTMLKGFMESNYNTDRVEFKTKGTPESDAMVLRNAKKQLLGKKYSTQEPPVIVYPPSGVISLSKNSSPYAFAKGGMVDFTGPAWVDGTKSRPEAFLNADDTKRIGEAAKLLSDLPLLNNPRTQTNEISNTNVGDTTFEIHINVENISSDYDVDQAVERVKQDIADAAQYAGSNVILKKK